ncbi:MAG: helicase associated domain-containing protein [Magnetococcales bacterium]|nr:helicase associated domain-containing protein [Magnetococcales bacterium]
MLPNHPDARRFSDQRLFNGLNCFRDLEKRLNELTDETDRAVAFALFIEGLLTIRPLPQAAEVLPLAAITPEIRRRLSLPLDWPGVQGFIRTVNGETFPYFSHYRPNRCELGTEELHPFLELMQQADLPLLVSNAEMLPKKMGKLENFQRLLGPDLDRLTQADFSAINRWLRGGGISPPRTTPSPSQAEGLRTMRDRNDSSAILTAPVGIDLLQTALHLIETLGSNRTGLVLLPSSIHLMSLLHHWQGLAAWSTLIPLFVCQELAPLKPSDLDFPLTCSSDGIRRFLSTRSSVGVKVILATNEALPLVQRALLGFSPIEMALIVEAHRLLTPQGDVLKNALEQTDLFIQRRYFITHTPQRFNPLKPNKEGEINRLYALTDHPQFGPLLTLTTAADAQQKKSLRPWKFLLPIIDQEDNHFQALCRCIQENPEIGHIHCRHDKSANAVEFVQTWTNTKTEILAPFKAFTLEGFKSRAEVAQQIGQYQNQNHALLSLAPSRQVGCRLPMADLIYFVKGAKREEHHTFEPVLTPRPGEGTGLFAVPLVWNRTTEQNQPESTEVATPNWPTLLDRCDDLWLGLQFFREQDQQFAEELRTIRIDYGRTGQWQVASLQHWLSPLATEPLDEQNQRRILIHCVQRLSTVWDERLGQLMAFRDQHNHCDIPQRWPLNPELSLWVEQQRKSWLNGTLDAHRIQELEQIGFIWEPKKVAWEKMFKALTQFKLQYRHCNVAKGWPDNPELADWVFSQRRAYQSQRLEPELAERLTALGFVWDLEAEAWATGFAAFQRFQKIQGHGQVPNPYPQNPDLALWAEAQRKSEKKATLSEQRIALLDDLGFIWDLEEAAWEERFRLFERFKQIYGHGKVPDTDKQLPRLSEWAANQRKLEQQGKLAADRKERLMRAGFIWDLEAAHWEEMFARLKAYKQHHHHCTLAEKPSQKGAEADLWLWSQEQRNLRLKERLHPSRINRLTAIGFAWDLKLAVWMGHFQEFRHFKTVHGHGKLPERSPKNPALALWAKTVRREWTMGRLDGEKAALLTEAGFVWDLEEAAWENGFNKLCKFYKKEGHFSIPPTLKQEPDLPGWVKKQRGDFARKRLKAERKNRLEQIDFVWDVREAAWEEMFYALAQFMASRKHCIVPQKWPENPRLAQWVSNLRRDYKKGTLPANQFERLNKLGFIWDAKAVFWEEMFVALTEYRELNGDCLVPENYQENSELGWWVATQRKARLTDQLDANRIERLAALDFIWDIEDAHWLEMYRQLFRFRQKTGHCLVGKSQPDSLQLALWAEKQRAAFAKQQLSPDQISRLSQLGFIWDSKQVVVEEMLAILRTFKAEHGHCQVPVQGSPYAQLGLWLQFQRQSFNNGTLDEFRQKKLQEVGFLLEG